MKRACDLYQDALYQIIVSLNLNYWMIIVAEWWLINSRSPSCPLPRSISVCLSVCLSLSLSLSLSLPPQVYSSFLRWSPSNYKYSIIYDRNILNKWNYILYNIMTLITTYMYMKTPWLHWYFSVSPESIIITTVCYIFCTLILFSTLLAGISLSFWDSFLSTLSKSLRIYQHQ